MCIVEAGKDRAALGIDHRCLRAAEPLDLALVPTRRILLPRTATASAIVPSGPAVYTFALRTIKSTGPSFVALRADDQAGDERHGDDATTT